MPTEPAISKYTTAELMVPNVFIAHLTNIWTRCGRKARCYFSQLAYCDEIGPARDTEAHPPVFAGRSGIHRGARREQKGSGNLQFLKDQISENCKEGGPLMAVKPIPEGYHSVTPFLIVKGAARAIDFYKQAFGANEIMRFPGRNNTVAHAEIQIGDSRIMLADGSKDYKDPEPGSG